MSANALNNLDRGYQYLLDDIMERGVEKDTRAGRVRSLFGKQFRIDLKEGFPLLTTKKVFTKGVIHELLWFLKRPCNCHGSSNIEYLVRNNVHIWDDDAFRWFKEWVTKEIAAEDNAFDFRVVLGTDDEVASAHMVAPRCETWEDNEKYKNDLHWLLSMEKDEFLSLVLKKVEITVYKKHQFGDTMTQYGYKWYRFGDLGPIYGKQWRRFGDDWGRQVDQIGKIIDTLKKNPNDRRMICLAFNPSVLDTVALPPCHVMMQFYTRPLTPNERWEIHKKICKCLSDDQAYEKCMDTYDKGTNPWSSVMVKKERDKILDEEKIPRYGLSCMWTQRSVDVCCGLPFNIASYALLTHMIAHLVNMEPDILIGSLGDCHIYENHFDGVKEQLDRKGEESLPILKINRKVDNINDYEFDDFEIVGYNPNPPIKYPLNVG